MAKEPVAHSNLLTTHLSLPRLGIGERQEGVGRDQVRVPFHEPSIRIDPGTVGVFARGQGGEHVMAPVVLHAVVVLEIVKPQSVSALAKVW